MTVHKEYPFVKIYYDDYSRSVITEWKGNFVRDVDLKRGLDEALAYFVSTGSTRWLGNTKSLGSFGPDTQNWINENWFPRFLATQVTHMAVVIPSSLFGKMSVDAVITTVKESRLKIQYFDDVEKARNWLANS